MTGAAIRAKLAEYDASMDATGSLWGAEEMRAALLAVLDIHAYDASDPIRWGCPMCETPSTCPTIQAIARTLGLGD